MLPRAAVASAALALLLLVPPPSASEAGAESNQFIQPGTEVQTTEGYCSLNFVWTGGGSTYIGTAGHCVNGIGGRVSTAGIGFWGTVVLDLDNTADYGLIRVDAAKVPLVRAAVQHWGGPTGIATPGAMGTGDLLVIYGYGVVFDITEATQAKQGVLLLDGDTSYEADTWAVPGDSGAPILLKDTGEAVGIVSAFNLPISTDYGPTLAHIEEQLAARGFDLQLQTAPTTGALV